MALAVFNQFPQLTRFFAQLARAAARKECVREFNRLDLSTGAATMKDRAMNVAALAGGEVTVTVPDADPGKARDFLLRAECTASTDLKFAGADFEGSEGDELNAPDEGETVVYFFTETKAGTFLVGRKVAEKLDNEEEGSAGTDPKITFVSRGMMEDSGRSRDCAWLCGADCSVERSRPHFMNCGRRADCRMYALRSTFHELWTGREKRNLPPCPPLKFGSWIETLKVRTAIG